MDMNRRTFVRVAGAGSLSMAGAAANAGTKAQGPLKAKQVNAYLRSLIAVDEPSVDRIVIGDPETEVVRIATAWMPYLRTLHQAVAKGVNTIVVHEPAFYTHWDLDAKEPEYTSGSAVGRTAYLQAIELKKKYIEEHGLVIIRCHDVLDRLPHFGIPFALGEALGFSESQIANSRRFYNVYEIDPAPARRAALRISEHLQTVGQPAVAFYGDPERVVKTVGLGTGCICDPIEFMDLHPDLFISIDDVVRTWVQTAYAEDTGHPLVVINHSTSEEFGVRRLSQHLAEHFSGVEVVHLPQGCGYREIRA